MKPLHLERMREREREERERVREGRCVDTKFSVLRLCERRVHV